MASYLQLGPGWRPNYEGARLERRRPHGRTWAALGAIAAVFGAGLLVGQLEARSGDSPSADSAQAFQYFPR